MRLRTIDGSEWEGTATTKRAALSKLEEKALELLRESHGSLFISQVQLPVYKNKKLPFDFFSPALMIAVEVQGQQHFKFTPHFHGSQGNFLLSKKRDMDKVEFCEINNITLIHLNYNESIAEWKKKLNT